MAKKFKKIKKKNSVWHYFQPKRDDIGWEREKKILVANSVHTRPGQENSEKNSKKFKQINKLYPALFLAKMG